MGSFYTSESGTDKEIYISNDTFLVMNTDGTAEYHDYGDLEYIFKYTWDTTKKEIYMVVEKEMYKDTEGYSTLMTYDQLLSKLTMEELKKFEKKNYEQNKEEYPDCESYEDYEKNMFAKYGYKDFEEYFKEWKEYSLKYFNTIFGAKVTYGYEFNKDEKMVLTEKFTGMKNFLLYEICSYDKDGTEVTIQFSKGISIRRSVNGKREDWDGDFGKGNSIEFEKEDSEPKEKKTGSYTEDIAKETVTVNFDGKDYPCEFRGKNFIEVDE